LATSEDNPSDFELLQLSARGDEEAFTTLYRRHQGAIFRFALHMSGRSDIAEEITQEVFLVVIRDADAFREERGTLEGFLIGIARNKIRRHLEGLRSGQTNLEDPTIARELSSPSNPYMDLARTRETDVLRAAILSLPARYREVTVLCDLEERTYEDAAMLLGCALGTVRSRLHRARKLLSARLRKLVNREGCAV